MDGNNKSKKENFIKRWMGNLLDIIVDGPQPSLPDIPSEVPLLPPPSIEFDQVEAVPLADGGYRVMKYRGCHMGWQECTTVKDEEALSAVIDNLRRPVKCYRVYISPPVKVTTGVEAIRELITEIEEYRNNVGYTPQKSFVIVTAIWIAKLERLVPTKKEKTNE